MGDVVKIRQEPNEDGEIYIGEVAAGLSIRLLRDQVVIAAAVPGKRAAVVTMSGEQARTMRELLDRALERME